MSKQCRLCAKFTESAIDLFLEHETSLITKINSFLPITISNDKGLPKKICCKCVERSNATHSFIHEVLLAQAVFGISNESPEKIPPPANSVMYGGVTISSTKKANISVPTTNKLNHKKSQNVSETLKKLKKMQTGMTISKTVVPGNIKDIDYKIPVRRCKTEPKSFVDENEKDDDNDRVDDEDNDPNFDGFVSDGNNENGEDYDDDGDGDDGDDGDDDENDLDYNPFGKKTKTTPKTTQNKSNNTESNPKFKSIKINAPPVFLCMKCKNKFDSLIDLKQHVFQKNACTTSQLTCKICNKTFENRKRLLQHSKSHEEKAKFICDKCGKMYTNQFNLENHKSAQHGEYLDEHQSVFKCRLCNAKFTNRTDLYSHMKTHTKDTQQLLCDTCGKCFNNAHNLRSHQKVHLDIRPFPCAMCPKRFRTRLLLKQHLHVHTGIKEFQCVHCSQSFAKQDSLRLHIKKRHPEHTASNNVNKLPDHSAAIKNDHPEPNLSSPENEIPEKIEVDDD